MHMRKHLIGLAVIALLGATSSAPLGAATGTAAGHLLVDATPTCPTEDSCTVDYRDGAWHVSEVTP